MFNPLMGFMNFFLCYIQYETDKAMLALQSHTCIGYRDNSNFSKDYEDILSLSSVLTVFLEARTK